MASLLIIITVFFLSHSIMQAQRNQSIREITGFCAKFELKTATKYAEPIMFNRFYRMTALMEKKKTAKFNHIEASQLSRFY